MQAMILMGCLWVGGTAAQAAGDAEPQPAHLSAHAVSVGRHQGRTAIMIDGRAIPGIAYLGPLRAADDPGPSSLKESVDAGMRIVLVPGGGEWPAPGRWDFSGYLALLERAAKLNPDLWLVARLDMGAPPWCHRNA